MLVFVEVKTSRIMGSLPPEIRVHENKRRKLESLARIYLKQKSDETSCRFDVVSVWWEAEETKIRHIEDAFRS